MTIRFLSSQRTWMMTAFRMHVFLLASQHALTAANNEVVLENEHFRYTIGADGKNLGFVDKASGRDYLRREPASVCASVWRDGKEYSAVSAAFADGRVVLSF